MVEQQIDLHEPASLFRHFRQVACPPYREVPVVDLPAVPRRLLAHRGHMTTALEEFYGGDVSIEVLEHARAGDWYTRAVLLHVDGCEGPVQFGIMGLDLGAVPGDVVRRVEEAREPLGRILVDVHPLRTVTPVAYWQFAWSSQWRQWFGEGGGSAMWGRTAVIECDRGPTVLLLEVVPEQPARRTSS